MTNWRRLFETDDDDIETGPPLEADPLFAASMAQLSSGAHAPLHDGTHRGEGDVYAGIAAIQSGDPTFDAHAFLSTVEAIFLRLRQAWAAGDDTEPTALLDPAFRAAWAGMVAAWRADPAASIFSGSGPPSLRLFSAVADANFDVIVVRLTVPAPPGASFAEFRHRWQFIRYHITDAGLGRAVAPTCPTCGAPLHAGEAACAYCGAALRVGTTFDWRLNGVTDVTHGEPPGA